MMNFIIEYLDLYLKKWKIWMSCEELLCFIAHIFIMLFNLKVVVE